MKKVRKIFKIILIVFLVIMLAFVVFQKVTNSKIAIGNMYIFQVATESMTPEYQVGDIIVVNKEDPSKIEVGDDVTYLGKASSVKNLRITHRVINKRKDNDKYYFTTKGIANEVEDPEINEDDLFGKVTYHTIFFSFIGRLMTNVVVYYVAFILVAGTFSYDFIMSTFFKKDDSDEKEE